MTVKKIAILASGSGTNAQNIIEYFSSNKDVRVEILLSNKPDALALKRAAKLGVQTFVFNRSEFYNSSLITDLLLQKKIDLIVLAGFLWLIPEALVHNFTIINIHPALLPGYGGKGMYGMNVHRAVIENGEKESGITIHYVNEKYDDGAVIFQAKCEVRPGDTAEQLAERVHQLEYQHFPRVIEKLLADTN